MTTDRTPDNEGGGVLLKVLTAHFKALVSARSDETLLRQYSALLRFVKSQPSNFWEGHVRAIRPETALLSPGLSEENCKR
jgi:hypothetical protein